MKIFTGPKGGRYYINDKGKKVYLKKDEAIEVDEIKEFILPVSDYEHRGDLNHAINYIKSICPEATDFRSWEERDYEAESDYEHEYGECDEPIMQGYIAFKAPQSYSEKLNV